MIATSPAKTSELIVQSRAGARPAFDELYARLYDDLRCAARGQLRRYRAGDTLAPTALVNEAYLRLTDEQAAAWNCRAHFLAVAARAMRRVIVDYVRERGAQKRGGGAAHVTLADELAGASSDPALLMAIDAALSELATFNERLARVAECRLFAGLSEEETAAALGTSLRTAQRDWQRARAWLQQALDD